jgi:glyoxalase superfamily protein
VSDLTYLDLIVETANPQRTAAFWSSVLVLDSQEQPDGRIVLSGAEEHDTLWFEQGPDQQLDGVRLHFDATHSEVDGFVSAGAVLEDDSGPWVVLRGPDNSELRVFPQETVEDHQFDLVYEVARPVVSVRWWSRQLGTNGETASYGDYAWVRPLPGSPFAGLVFVQAADPDVHQPRAGGAMMRFRTDDLRGLLIAGASMRRRLNDSEYLLADPSGVPFRVVADPPA